MAVNGVLALQDRLVDIEQQIYFERTRTGAESALVKQLEEERQWLCARIRAERQRDIERRAYE